MRPLIVCTALALALASPARAQGAFSSSAWAGFGVGSARADDARAGGAFGALGIEVGRTAHPGHRVAVAFEAAGRVAGGRVALDSGTGAPFRDASCAAFTFAYTRSPVRVRTVTPFVRLGVGGGTLAIGPTSWYDARMGVRVVRDRPESAAAVVGSAAVGIDLIARPGPLGAVLAVRWIGARTRYSSLSAIVPSVGLVLRALPPP